MQKRPFGKTGIDVSILGFGCMRLPLTDPGDPASIDYDLASAMLHTGIEGGINYVDTAYPYHSRPGVTAGESEPFLGKALQGGWRDKIYLATKLFARDLKSRAQMDALLDEQLERLQTTHIDFYLIHNLHRNNWPFVRDLGLYDFFEKARAGGKIRHIGFSFHDNYDLFEEILDDYPWEFAQIQYNYLDVEHQAGIKGLKLASGKGVGTAIMEPLRGGFLIKSMPDETRDLLARARPAWSLADWGLRWIWNHPEADLVLSGMSTMEQVQENLAMANSASLLTARDLAAIDEVRAYFRSRVKVGCTSCGYCMPCPSGLTIPKLLGLYNDYYLFDADASRARAKMFYSMTTPKDVRASACVHCGACEEKCPQGIAVSEAMTEIATLYETGK
jgi:predicted aldo/keto reductase-like oxidoreductase